MQSAADTRNNASGKKLLLTGTRSTRNRSVKTSSNGEPTALHIAPLPKWVAVEMGREGKERQGTFASNFNASFLSGAALFALDQILRADPPWLSVLRMRLTLKATVAAARILRLDADEADLRDAEHLTRPGDDPGPAGRLHRFLRRLASQPSHLSDGVLERLEEELGDGEDASDVIQLLKEDVAVGTQLGWSMPLLLHLTAILHPSFRQGETGRRPRTDDQEWTSLQPAVLTRACIAAHAQAVNLHRQTAALAQALNGLRTREGNKGLALILSDDCVAPWRMVGKHGLGSDRAARRFCERLVKEGVLRLLTQRPTFRIYGL